MDDKVRSGMTVSKHDNHHNFFPFQSDMYSLGVILFEMYCPFSTGMERSKAISGLRQGQLPPAFKAKFPHIGRLVLRMTSRTSKTRPSASELLNLFAKEFNLSQRAKDRIAKLEAEVRDLKAELGQKDSVIESLRQEVAKLSQSSQ